MALEGLLSAIVNKTKATPFSDWRKELLVLSSGKLLSTGIVKFSFILNY